MSIAPPTTTHALEVEDLHLAYRVRGIPREVLRGVTFHVRPGEAYGLEDLMALTGIGAPRLLARLTEFELRGLVTSVGGGRYVRPPAAK